MFSITREYTAYKIERLDDFAATKLYTATGPNPGPNPGATKSIIK